MFENTKAFSSFSVSDLEKAKKFYEDTLGLQTKTIDMGEGNKVMELHIPGGAMVMIYPKPNHTPASFTVLNFPAKDVEKSVDELIAKGVKFEQYHNEWMDTDEKGILRGMGPTIAWFADPAGNIISVVEER